jgi:F like protein
VAAVIKASKCAYCKKPATKAVIWADGRAYIPVCDEHLAKARHRVTVTNHDEVTAVRGIGEHALVIGWAELETLVAAVGDQWLPQRLRAVHEVVKAESALYARLVDLLSRWAARLRGRVLTPGGQLDPYAVFAVQPWYERELNDVTVEIREVFDGALHDVDDDPLPNALAHMQAYLASSKNRLVNVPDSVYNDVRAATMKANTEGMSIDELSQEIDKILGEADVTTWRHRARVIARTEAVGAYNGGRFAGSLSIAKHLGGAWEKQWLATDDHRTRPTHVEADGQRVALTTPFTVGGFLGMFPGDPALPAQEVIQCRCTFMLVRPGEQVDMTSRQFRPAPPGAKFEIVEE